MKKILVFIGLLALVFAANIRGVVEGSLLPSVVVLPAAHRQNIAPVLTDNQLFQNQIGSNQTARPLNQAEIFRLVDTSV